MLKATVQHDGFGLDQKLSSFINEKILKTIKNYNKISDFRVYLKQEKSEDLKNKIVKIKIQIPGKQVTSNRTGEKFDKIFETAIKTLENKIEKHLKKQELTQ